MHQSKDGGLQANGPLTASKQLQFTPEPTTKEQLLSESRPQQQGDGIEKLSGRNLTLPLAQAAEQ
jgi:hypothetical protein